MTDAAAPSPISPAPPPETLEKSGVPADGAVARSADLLERLRAEEALRASELILKEILDAIPARVFWKDRDLVYRGCNLAFARDAGFASADEVIGKDDHAMGWRDQADAYRSADREVIESGASRELFDERQTTPGGSIMHLLTSKVPLHGAAGEVVGVLGTYLDITGRRRAEQELAASELRYRRLFESALDGILILDALTGTVVDVNPFLIKRLGFSHEEFLGKKIWELGFFKDIVANQDAFVELQQQEYIRYEDKPLETADGRRIDVEFISNVYEADHRKVIQCNIRDITQRKLDEKAHTELVAQLNLGKKLEALGALSAGVAHDFNNILASIIGNAELARLDVGAGHAALESLDEIRKAGRRAKELVHRILIFGSQHRETQVVISLRPIIEEAVRLLRATLPAGVKIVATFAAGAPRVQGDGTHIHQVLINLGTNAWQAMDGRSGTIEIRLDGVALDGDAARAAGVPGPGRFARLSVTDTGKGMGGETLQRAFDPFFTTKPVGQGTGLGLSVVHGTMKAHGGAVTVTSEPGRGSTFSLYFPAAEPAETGAPPDAAAIGTRPAGAGRHVLYLDDEESLVFLVSRMLTREGYRVSGFTRAEEALAAVRANPGQFDLVVTDLNMPGASGLDVAREVASLRPDLPVVLASGSINDELRVLAPLAGVRELIYKPNTVEELCEVVGRLAGPARPA